ncbi:hypothetical protein CN311_17190 [Mesorhizobium sanjuanii]|uniref:Uncharacterized protein n=2 Tax=Mesorhizobium sanjuanii TaxID=2037900 RepID=A0A2A6FDH5_9HYPH|nr:hypothetical protein CN311_17190 [Mesorhizobium sanjuanii]
MSGIEKNSKTIAGLMGNYDINKDAISLEMTVCQTRLNLIKQSVKGRSKSSIRSLIREIRQYRGERNWLSKKPPPASQGAAWHLYERLNGLIEELKHFQDDQRFGG